MAAAKAQGQGGISAIHVWLIVFVALWLTSTVLLVILYLDQDQMEKDRESAIALNSKLITSEGKKLAQFSMAKSAPPGPTMVDLLESERSALATLVSNEASASVDQLRKGLENQLTAIQGSGYVEDPSVFDGVPYGIALENVYALFERSAQAGEQAEDQIDDLTTELQALRDAQGRQKTEFDEQAAELKDRVAAIGNERDDYRRSRDEEIDAFEGEIEKIKQQCSDDIQSQRGETTRLRNDYGESLARYQELKDKLGQSQVSPIPLATARVGDGRVLKAAPGDPVVYINLGARDHLTLGLEFAVYDSLRGIPADGQAKARIEVVRINEQSAECRIVEMLGYDMIMGDDIIANPIYDRHRRLKFFVMGTFDLDGNRKSDPDGLGRIADIIRQWGGIVEQELSAQVDFVVMGARPRRAQRSNEFEVEDDVRYLAGQRAVDDYNAQAATVEVLAIPTLTQSVLLNFLGRTEATELPEAGPEAIEAVRAP